MKRSLSDNMGYGMVGILQFFIFHKVGSGLDTERYQALICYVSCCELFSLT